MPVEYDPHPLPFGDPPVATSEDHSYEFLVRVQEAISSPSPLMRIIEDPSLLGQSKPKSKHPRRPSRSPHREHRSPFVVALALAEEEKQANTLKSLLKSTSDHLDYERRRAEEATARANDADLRAQRATFKASTAESAQRQLEEQISILREELRRVQSQNETLGREVRRTREDMRRIEQENEELQSSVHSAKEKVRNLQLVLREFEVREESRDDSRRQQMERCFEEGQDEGWNTGYEKGYKDGKRAGYTGGVSVGRREGVREGQEQGRNEERRNALEAFDRFLADQDDTGSEKALRGIRTYYPADNDSISSLGDSASRRGRI